MDIKKQKQPILSIDVELEFPKTIYLEKEFRNMLFCKAYKKAGESLAAIGRDIGYPARDGLNGTIRDMWLGVTGIPRHRIERLAKYVGVPLNSIKTHLVSREENTPIDDWVIIYKNYKRRKSRDEKSIIKEDS